MRRAFCIFFTAVYNPPLNIVLGRQAINAPFHQNTITLCFIFYCVDDDSNVKNINLLQHIIDKSLPGLLQTKNHSLQINLQNTTSISSDCQLTRCIVIEITGFRY